mgnify:CR=1 FL=1
MAMRYFKAIFFPAILSSQFLMAQGPDRILLSIGEDPLTGKGVSWRMDSTILCGFVELAVAKAAPVADSVRFYPAKLEKLDNDGRITHYFSVMFAGLKTEALYMYRVGSNTQLFQRVRVASDHQTVEAITASGEIYDSFNIQKNRWIYRIAISCG